MKTKEKIKFIPIRVTKEYQLKIEANFDPSHAAFVIEAVY